MEAEFPGFRIVPKHESRFQTWIHRALMLITFGRLNAYLDGYQTTLGRTIYVTPDWQQLDPDQRRITLEHERVHLRQFQKFTTVGMALLYLFLPLPMGLAYFRARFEKQAYAQTIRATARIRGLDAAKSSALREQILSQFVGPSYGWMWPFPKQLNRWYDEVIASLE